MKALGKPKNSIVRSLSEIESFNFFLDTDPDENTHSAFCKDAVYL